MKSCKIILVFVVLLMTKMSFADCSVDLTIIPPKSDGGSPLLYYRVERTTLESGIWIKCGDFRADASIWPWYDYANVTVRISNLEEGKQYLFRVFAVNNNGPGEPGDYVSVPKLKNDEIFGPIDIHCGEGVPEKRSFDVSSFLLKNDTPNVQIPYRVEE